MSQDYLRKQEATDPRKSLTSQVSIGEEDKIDNSRRSSIVNVQRRLSTVSQVYLPHGSEYHAQAYVPPTGPEAQPSFILTAFEGDGTTVEQRRISVVSQIYRPIEEEKSDQSYQDEKKLNKKTSKILYVIEPIISGLILFPILVLFWQCGWNLILILLNILNGFPSNLYLTEMTQDDFGIYTWQSLICPYLVVQFLLLLYYVCQDRIYKFLKDQKWIIKTVLLKFHIFVLATIYVIQWEMLWTILDQFTPHEWYFEFALSLAALFALIVFNGHLSDLVCSPFLFSYDSIEYCIHFGCPLLTKDMKQWKINLINFILYEIIISNLSVITWRGLYHNLDDYFYPNDLNMSAGICLVIGYLLYFPLMYFQRYLEELNIKYESWTFVSINFPQFYRNIRHLLAFVSCVFVWRGFWLLYDGHVYIFEDYYKTYLIFYLLSFFVLCLFQTASSTNGPLSSMEDENHFFPLYPHCYVSKVQRKLCQLPFFRKRLGEEITKL